jgi:hypothetical protein
MLGGRTDSRERNSRFVRYERCFVDWLVDGMGRTGGYEGVSDVAG